MQFFLFLGFTATAAGILPPDSTEFEPPNLPDLQKPPPLGTMVSDNDLTYNGLPLSKFASHNDALTIPDFSDRENDRTSVNLIDPDEPGSNSMASVNLGEPEIQTSRSEIVTPSTSRGDDTSLTAMPNPDSDEISSTDPSSISSTALTGADTSGRICRPRKSAISGKRVATREACINLGMFMDYTTDSNTPDTGTYSDEEIKRNNEVSKNDERWTYRHKLEEFDTEWDMDQALSRCESTPGGRKLPFCCLGPFEWVNFGQRLKPRRNDKRFSGHSLNAGNCVLYFYGLPRCADFPSAFCCAKYGARMRWGTWGVDCVLMDP